MLDDPVETAIEYARERGVDLRLEPLPASAWGLLEAVPAIQTGGEPHMRPNIYVVFDANCPHCATLYGRLQRGRFSEFAARWVPIAYLNRNSARLAAAMLASDEPRESLHTNFRKYDNENHHGGYHASQEQRFGLAPGHAKLKKHWRKWGGRTPMIIVRTEAGDVFEVLHEKGDGLLWALKLAGSPELALESYTE